MLMSFIGAVGNLMTETGLADIKSSAFTGVHKMLVRQEISNVHEGPRMVVEVILEPVLKELEVGCCDTFMGNLEEKAQKSRTCRLWLDSLIKPVLLMMSYVRAEREGDWLLHVQLCESHDAILLCCWPSKLCKIRFGLPENN